MYVPVDLDRRCNKKRNPITNHEQKKGIREEGEGKKEKKKETRLKLLPLCNQTLQKNRQHLNYWILSPLTQGTHSLSVAQDLQCQ